jgi:hypothetical protein
LDKADLQLKAGIVSPETTELLNKTKEHAEKIKISIKEIDPIADNKKIMEAARKESDREREQRIKIDFDALNFSRISNEARKQITEIVKQDLENKIKQIEKNTPEINEDTKSEGDFMYNWIREKSGKKKPNPKQMDGVKSDVPFVKTRKK